MYCWPWEPPQEQDWGYEDAVQRKLRHIAHQNDQILERTQRAIELLDALTTQGVTLMSDLTSITNAVEAERGVVDSAITLLTQLAGEISALKNDPVALQALADQITTDTTDLANAVAANTPASVNEPAPEPAPEV